MSFRHPLVLNDVEDALKGVPGLLFHGSAKGFRSIRGSVGHKRQRLDFIHRTKPAVIEIGQSKSESPAEVAPAFLPVRLSRSEIQLLFIFAGAQIIKIGVRGCGFYGAAERRMSLPRRPAK